MNEKKECVAAAPDRQSHGVETVGMLSVTAGFATALIVMANPTPDSMAMALGFAIAMFLTTFGSVLWALSLSDEGGL